MTKHEIEINEKETYCLELPDLITKTEFIGVMERLNRILKLVSNDVFKSEEVSANKIVSNTFHVRTNAKYTRSDAVKILTMYYSEEDMNKREAKITKLYPRMDRNRLKSYINYAKKKWGIMPKDVGMVRFPDRSEGRNSFDKLRITKKNGN